jgi:hypothetical protein
MRRRHPDVDDHEVGLVLADEVEELARITCLADDLEVGALEQAGEAFAQKDVVLGDGDTAAARGRLVRAGTLRAPPRANSR